jgi:hypothetical protein
VLNNDICNFLLLTRTEFQTEAFEVASQVNQVDELKPAVLSYALGICSPKLRC